MNVVELIGNLGKDPIMRATRTGRSVASFSVATSREIVNPQTGEKREITDWIQCVAWGVWAEAAGAHLKKGTRVHIIGRIQTRSYDAQDRDETLRDGGGGGKHFHPAKHLFRRTGIWPFWNAASGAAGKTAGRESSISGGQR